MSQRETDWQWDSTARLWYRFDPYAGCELFENGSQRMRAQQPRNIPPGPRDPPSRTHLSSSPTTKSSAYDVGISSTANLPRNATSSTRQPANDKRPEARNERPAVQAQDPLTHDFAKIDLNANAARQPLHNETRKWTAENGDRFLDVRNPVSEVQTTLQLGPANRITDPALLKQGIKATQMLIPTRGAEERLFDNYKLREQPKKFFSRGKVFRVLWSEPAGDNRTNVTFEAAGITTTRFGERVHSKVRLFVVIREGENYCSALPIVTYGEQGVAKRGVDKSEHSIVYCGRNAPDPFLDEAPRRGEEGMRPDAIRVNPDDRTDILKPRSRIDYGKVYTIQHNIKVQPYGQVHPASEAALRHQFLNVWIGETAAGAVAQSSTDSTATNTAPVRTSQRRPSRRDSQSTKPQSTRIDTSGSGQALGSSVAAHTTREAQAQAAVQRLMQAGRSQKQAIEMVRVTAMQQQQAAGRASTSDDGDEDEESQSDDSEATSNAPESSSNRLAREVKTNRSVGSGQQQQHPPRVDSRTREHLPPRRTEASISANPYPPVRVESQNRPQQPLVQEFPRPASYDLPRSQTSATTAATQGRGQVPALSQKAPQQTPNTAQIQAAIQQLMQRNGWTYEQARDTVVAGLPRQRNAPQ